MDKLFKRITVVQLNDGQPAAVVVYKKKSGKVRKARRKTSPPLRPIERAVRHTLKAVTIGGEDGYDRHLKSGKRRNRWLIDAPSNFAKASRKAYKEVRKGVPFTIMPKFG